MERRKILRLLSFFLADWTDAHVLFGLYPHKKHTHARTPTLQRAPYILAW